MPVKRSVSRGTLRSNLAKSDAHVIQPGEYDELPELSEEMLTRAVVRKGGRPRSDHPRQLVTLRLPQELVARWRATGPGWQTRMVQRLGRLPLPGGKSKAP
jgi:uncharacterized protein (DUF4415 family)